MSPYRRSAVLTQLESWAGSTSTPPILAFRRPPEELRKRVHSLLNASEASKFAQLRKLSAATIRDDLPTSMAFVQMIFGADRSAPGKMRAVKPRQSGSRLSSDARWEPGGRGRPPGSTNKGRSSASKDSGEAAGPAEVKSLSRSGRAVKTPSKFKEPHSPRGKAARMFLQQTSPRSSAAGSAGGSRLAGSAPSSRGRGRPRNESAADDDAAGEPREVVDTGSRVGETYQVDVGADPMPNSCHERGDVLLWSAATTASSEQPTSPGVDRGASVLQAYLERALPLLGGAPTYPPTQAAAHELFPTELAFIALHRAGGSTDAALAALGRAEGVEANPSSSEKEWSKVEERHFRAAFTKQRGNMLAIHEAVRTKSLPAVVRLYFVEDGVRLKDERDRKREIELLRLSRGRPSDKNRDKEDARAETPSNLSEIGEAMEEDDVED